MSLPARTSFDLAILLIRIPVGFHLLYGVIDNILSWERMLEFRDFLHDHNFPFPLFSAILSVYAQFLCGLMFIAGIKIRYAAAMMIANFTLALAGVHFGDAYPPAFPAIIILCCSLFLFLQGGGKWQLQT